MAPLFQANCLQYCRLWHLPDWLVTHRDHCLRYCRVSCWWRINWFVDTDNEMITLCIVNCIKMCHTVFTDGCTWKFGPSFCMRTVIDLRGHFGNLLVGELWLVHIEVRIIFLFGGWVDGGLWLMYMEIQVVFLLENCDQFTRKFW